MLTGFLATRAVGHYGAIVLLLATALTFWYMAWAMLGIGVAENLTAGLFLLRGMFLVISGGGEEFMRIDIIAVNQIVALASVLADTGVKIAIDDFGTGYSSLNYLRKLPISQLKIDRSFVMDLDEERADRRLIESILSLARALGLEVVAEGIESAHSLLLLRELECEYGQGFHISRPLPVDRFETWLESVGVTRQFSG